MSDPTTSDTAPTTDQLLEALKVVIDPELGINVVDLGLVYDVTLEEGIATITYSLTTMGCPIGPMIEQQMTQVLTVLPGVNYVDARLTFDPAWSAERMSEEARLAMGMF